MKKTVIFAIALLTVVGGVQAGSGKTFGAVLGGTFLGNTLSNAMSRPKTVVVTEGSGSHETNRAVRRLSQDLEDLYDTVEKLRKAIKELDQKTVEKITDLGQEVAALKKETGNSKTTGKKSWIDELL